MKNIFLLALIGLVITSCSKPTVRQEVQSNGTSYDYTFDSTSSNGFKYLTPIPYNQYVLITEFYSETERGYVHFATDFGTVEEIDSIKCIRYSQCEKEVEVLKRLNQPCENLSNWHF